MEWDWEQAPGLMGSCDGLDITYLFLFMDFN
jgi:hypothetical protein